MSNELFLKNRYTLPWMEWQVVNEQNCPINFETLGASKVTFTMVRTDRKLTPVLIEVPAEFADKAKGILRYRWNEYDTMYPAWHYSWFTVYYPSIISGGAFASNIYETVTYTADEKGENGNLIVISFTGSNTIAEAVTAWNTAHPTNTVSHDAGDDTVVPSVGDFSLTGGVDQIINIQKIAYPDQKEKLEVTIDTTYGQEILPPGPPTPPSIEDWLEERKRENFVPVGNIDGVNQTFTTYPYWFTMSEAFKLHVRLNGRELTKGVDYNVLSSDPVKLGYNTIIFEDDVAIPQPGDVLLCDFYISDSI